MPANQRDARKNLARIAGTARAAATGLVDRPPLSAEFEQLRKSVDTLAKRMHEEEESVLEAELGRLDYPGEPIYMVLGSKKKRQRLRATAKEPWTIEWIERHLRPGEVLYDVGANLGAYTLVAAKVLREDATVVALEPSYSTYAGLCDNVLANRMDQVITALPVALGAETGLGDFTLSDVRAGTSFHGGDEAAADDERGPSALRQQVAFHQPVLTYRLDDLVDRLGLPAPNHMKLDVDGAEAKVLEGAPRTLASGVLKSVMVEVADENADQIVGQLEGAGLPLRERYDRGGGQTYWYGLFARSGT